jgi:hypothetical protein
MEKKTDGFKKRRSDLIVAWVLRGKNNSGFSATPLVVCLIRNVISSDHLCIPFALEFSSENTKRWPVLPCPNTYLMESRNIFSIEKKNRLFPEATKEFNCYVHAHT